VTLLLRALAVGVGIALTAGLVVGSALPFTAAPEEQAMIRLSWRAVGERVEACREPTEAELAALPPHMRQSEICEARLTPFRLAVAIDGTDTFEGQIKPGGARGDRPAYVLQDFPVTPGSHRLSVEFGTVSDPGASASSPPLTLDESVTLAPREILLVTTASESDRLIVLEQGRE
jgi:hypothetical protein